MAQWFIRRENRLVGPLSAQQLRELALAGKLQSDDLVRKGDSGEFVPASRNKKLFAPDKATSRPTPPPPRLPETHMPHPPAPALPTGTKPSRRRLFPRQLGFIVPSAVVVLILAVALLPSWWSEPNRADSSSAAEENGSSADRELYAPKSFFGALPSSIDSEEFAGERITLTGRWSNMGNARTPEMETIADKMQLTVDTEFNGVSARCRFNRGDGERVRKAIQGHSQITITGTLAGRFPHPVESEHIIILEDCVVDELRENGEETIRKFQDWRKRPKAETFIAQIASMQGLPEDSPLPKRRFDQQLGYFNQPRFYRKPVDRGWKYEFHYDDWVDAFGEPTNVRTSPHSNPGMGHVWQHTYNGKSVYLSGVLKTALHWKPLIDTETLAPNSNPRGSWTVLVHAVSAD